MTATRKATDTDLTKVWERTEDGTTTRTSAEVALKEGRAAITDRVGVRAFVAKISRESGGWDITYKDGRRVILRPLGQRRRQVEASTAVTTMPPTVHAMDAAPTSGVCSRCDRTWPESDLSEDVNGDPVCCDCHQLHAALDDRAEYRAYAHR
jgi:hypothetical protein